MFKFERNLVREFIKKLRDGSGPWGTASVSCEFTYDRGCADIVALTESGEIVAFEAKLRNWRHALDQAYRNTCFAEQSFVLLPHSIAMYAQRYSDEFHCRNVGLCYIQGGHVELLITPQARPPLEPWLLDEALAVVTKSPNGSRRPGTNRTQDM